MYMKFLIKYYVRKKIELLNFKSSKLGQILCADKTGFRRLGHIYDAVFTHTFTHHIYGE